MRRTARMNATPFSRHLVIGDDDPDLGRPASAKASASAGTVKACGVQPASGRNEATITRLFISASSRTRERASSFVPGLTAPLAQLAARRQPMVDGPTNTPVHC